MKKNPLKAKIERVKARVRSAAPEAQNIEVKVQKLPQKDQNRYECFIKAHVPPKKEVVARRIARSPFISLEKSRQAVLRQIDKKKSRAA